MAPDQVIMYFHGGGVTIALGTAATSGNGDGGRSSTEGWSSNFCDWSHAINNPHEESPWEKWWRWWTNREKSIDAILDRARHLKPLQKAVQLVRRRFERRSEPRWSALRWKAKT